MINSFNRKGELGKNHILYIFTDTFNRKEERLNKQYEYLSVIVYFCDKLQYFIQVLICANKTE